MSSTRAPKYNPLSQKFDLLATYNSEIARGLVHTVAWAKQMATLQAEFDLEQAKQLARWNTV